MNRVLYAPLFLLLVITGVSAQAASAAEAPASFASARSLLTASSSPGNAYAVGASVVVTAPTYGDLTAIGGSVITASTVSGDETILGGSISSRAQIKGDFRAIGGNINITEPVAGDIVAFGYAVHDAGKSNGSVFIIGANVSLDSGASGPVTIYGNNVYLSGEFASNVSIVASGSITLAKDTIIRGTLSYEAPDTARIPATATIIGGTKYTNATYLPDAGTSRALALASIGIFLLVRILGTLLLAGLLAGLFPSLARLVTEQLSARRVRNVSLTTLLGFGVIVATPILLALLALTFIGLGIALLLFVVYILLVFLAYVYAGILVGTVSVRYLMKREIVLWHDGVLGMLALSLIALIPVVGWIIVCVLTAFSAGALFLLFFQFAFPRGESTPEML